MSVATRNFTNHELLLGTISDIYKDIHGLRPSLSRYIEMSDEQLEAEIERMSTEFDREEREEIQIFMSYGAPDQATARAWMGQVYDAFF